MIRVKGGLDCRWPCKGTLAYLGNGNFNSSAVAMNLVEGKEMVPGDIAAAAASEDKEADGAYLSALRRAQPVSKKSGLLSFLRTPWRKLAVDSSRVRRRPPRNHDAITVQPYQPGLVENVWLARELSETNLEKMPTASPSPSRHFGVRILRQFS